MKKICIISDNELFFEDFLSQLKFFIPEDNITSDIKEENIDMFLVDENDAILETIYQEYKTIPIAFFSDKTVASSYADIVITKPFSLLDIIKSIKENKLFPKVRRKECLNFKEYSLFPVKKEISSSKNNKIIKLTEKEVTILKYLYNNIPNIISKEELLENVWGYSIEMTTHTIETHIYRLRQKIEQYGGSQVIITENNGYRLNI
ncbi:MAG: response regulator transcription factor [Alphaproteobacteria bacterium]|nr:response regulator transcription factor [Alphaproteobacteria bacterium]